MNYDEFIKELEANPKAEIRFTGNTDAYDWWRIVQGPSRKYVLVQDKGWSKPAAIDPLYFSKNNFKIEKPLLERWAIVTKANEVVTTFACEEAARDYIDNFLRSTYRIVQLREVQE